MKKVLMVLAFAITSWFAAPAAFADSPAVQQIRATAAAGHGGVLTWTNNAPGASTNIYSAPCTGTVTGTAQTDFGIVGACSVTPTASAFTLLINVKNGVSTYSDTSLGLGVGEVYYATALCPTGGCTDGTQGESAPSNQVAVLTPPNPSFTMSAIPTTLSYAFTIGGTAPTPQALALVSTPATTLPNSVTSDSAWLTVTPTSGATKETITVSVNVAGLAANTYTGHVIFTNTDGTALNSPYSVPVTLVVTAPAKPAAPTLSIISVQ